ncbi:enoyl-CoA hydratase-related protein [Salimicrobium flavidum]|uniref:Enoyl-CoA hydratase/carnithine racemase n=1 Tax=Salimicrobium flavidum TaxID=570947 RepID=A0A1N7J8G6_9BACI|nr:enoyl-CoA hydratase-related protein [Salimicrobium flavidum]SIS45629.1 Enoyl-CoA hydratase/carnithine racemase [Salimicrobium flavidum]
MAKTVTIDRADEYAVIVTLNRPDAANSLSHQMLDELQEAVKFIESDRNVRVVLLTGSGAKAFCAGADLKERKGMDDEEVIETVEKIGDTVKMVEALPVPVIAVMNGVAFGGGLELALACDLRMISSVTRVGLTETSLAIIPGAGGTQRLSRLIGKGNAKAMIYTARPVEAERAYSLGIAEYMHDPQFLMDEALELAGTIARNGPIAIREAKTAIDSGIEKSLEEGLKKESDSYRRTIPTKDRKEGLQAFSEKRKPHYRGE